MSLDVTPEYAKSLGRIGGQLLSDNLLFQGQDIQFDTDLLYLDVANKRIAINNFGASPFALFIGSSASDQKILTNNLIVDGVTTTNNGWTIQTNNIQPPAAGILYIQPVQAVDPIIATNGVGTDKVNIFDRLIVANNINDSINISPTSTLTNFTGNLTVQGTVGLTYITGNALIDGDYIAGSQINLGDNVNDVVDFNSEINSDLIPSLDNTYTLSNSSEKWGFLESYNLTATNSTNSIGTFGGISIVASSIFNSNNARDITISTQAGSLEFQFDSVTDGGFLTDLLTDEYDGGFSSDAQTSVLDGGVASSSFTSSNVFFNGFAPITDNNFNNNAPSGTYNPAFRLLSTGDGFVRFAGTSGIVIPFGTTEQRETEILGTTRYNTDSGFLEIYNGSFWQNSIGIVALATQQNIEDDSVIYDLMLG